MTFAATDSIDLDFAEPITLDFDESPAIVQRRDAAPGFSLRDYQHACLDAIWEGWTTYSRILAVLATGAGKTIIFSQVARHVVASGGRVLILAHTEELLEQAAVKLERSTGLSSDREKASDHASLDSRVVIASVQTLSRENRLTGFPDNHFTHVIVDESHRALAASYQKILRYFHFGEASLSDEWKPPETGVAYEHKAKILGVTATGDRGDKRDLGQFFQKLVFEYGLLQACRDGYLVRPISVQVPLKIDLRNVKVSRSSNGSDFDVGELTRRITPFLAQIAHHIVEQAADRKVVCFLPGIETARLLSEAVNAAGIACKFVSGACPDRTEKLEWFNAVGNGHAICNAMLLTEGWDCLDSETEILTSDGWKSFEHFERGDQSIGVYSLNRDTGAMELTPIQGYGRRLVREGERMLSIESQHVDIRTTEGHQFFVKYRNRGVLSKNYIGLTGAELAARRSAYALPVSAELEFPFGAPLTDDEIRFVAWFMTDGGFERGGVVISQSKAWKDDIRALIVRLGFDFRERVRTNRQSYANAKPLHCFYIPKGNHRGTLARNGWERLSYWLNKGVAPLMHQMTRAQFGVFWTELLKGDGEQVNGMSGLLWCNKEQADAYTMMATLRGYAASCTPRTGKTGVVMYRVGIRDRKFLTSDPADKRAARMTLGPKKPRETVWCVRNRNGTLVTRRNGRIAIIGNCPDVSCVCVLRPTKIRSLYTQMVGRGTRTLAGTIDGLETRGERLAAIAASRKPDLRILDFLWLSDRLDLVKPIDLVATTPEMRDKMAKAAEKSAIGDILDLAEAADKDLLKSLEMAAKRNEKKKARVIDPLAWAVSLGDNAIAGYEPENAGDSRAPTQGQIELLKRNGIDTEKVTFYGLASKLIDRVVHRQQLGLCTVKQLNFLEQLGVKDAALLSIDEATKTIGAILARKRNSPHVSR